MFVRATLDSPELTFTLLTRDASALPATAPVAVAAPGMSEQRQWYLHDTIREYVADELKDMLCPRPGIPKPYVYMLFKSTVKLS